MRMKRRLFLTAAALWAALAVFVPAKGEETAQRDEEFAVQMDKAMQQVDFDSVQSLVVPGLHGGMPVQDAVRAIISGETVDAEAAVLSVLGLFFDALSRLGRLFLSLMTPVLLSSVLSHTLCGAEEFGDLSRSVSLMLVLIPIVLLVFSELEHTRQMITQTTERMNSMLPLLLTLLTALGGHASSAFLHPMVVAASGSMVFLAQEVILRLVMCTCAVTTINHLSRSVHLTRMAQLLRSAVCWLLGVSFTVFLGAMSLQGVCSASIDGVVIRAAKYAVDNFVPIVGGMFSDTMDTLVGCTLIVKNALGVCAALVLMGTILAPLVSSAAVVFLMKLCAALLEPVADAQVVRAIGDSARTIVLFLVTMLCVGTMYFLLIVQMLLVGNLTVLLR